MKRSHWKFIHMNIDRSKVREIFIVSVGVVPPTGSVTGLPPFSQ